MNIIIDELQELNSPPFDINRSQFLQNLNLTKELWKLGKHDLYTLRHSISVGILALKLYTQLKKLPAQRIESLNHLESTDKELVQNILISCSAKNILENANIGKIRPLFDNNLIIVDANLKMDHLLNPKKLISQFSDKSQLLFKHIYEKEEPNWTNSICKNVPLSKSLILADVKDLQVLANNSIEYTHSDLNEKFSFIELKLNYNQFIKKYFVYHNIFSKAAQFELFIGAVAHDLGKSEVSLNILNKKSQLDKEEYAIMKAHPIGSFASILNVINNKYDFKIALMGLLHHERYDGFGYPLQLKQTQIPLEARIIAIADAYHAMTSTRTYRKGMSVENALQIFKSDANNKQGHWDPQLTSLFINMIKN